MIIRDRTALAAIAGLIVSGGVLAAAHVVALEAGAGPDRTTQIIQLSQAEFDAMTNTKLNEARHNLVRHNTAAGATDAATAATIVRINNALIAHP